jgi:pimeloyl-ACP methyl ester carboxylesterase
VVGCRRARARWFVRKADPDGRLYAAEVHEATFVLSPFRTDFESTFDQCRFGACSHLSIARLRGNRDWHDTFPGMSVPQASIRHLMVSAGRHTLSTFIMLPDPSSDPRLVLFCAHGGSYSKEYWHFPGYSFAQYMAESGCAVVAYDRPGTGQSTRPDDLWALTSVEIGAAHHSLLMTVVAEYGWDGIPRVGIGHSMGAMLFVRQQSKYSSFDGVVLLGWSNFGLRLGDRVDAPRDDLRRRLAERLDGVRRPDAEGLLGSERDAWAAPLGLLQRANLSLHERRALFYGDGVPLDVMEMDETMAAFPVTGAIMLATLIDDIVREDAATIGVPVFLGLGERDVSRDPWREPSCFTSSTDVTLHVLSRSGHCHNFAPTRVEQWDRIRTWMIEVVRCR